MCYKLSALKLWKKMLHLSSRVWKTLSAFAIMYISVRPISLSFRRFFFYFWIGEKNPFSILANSNTKFFFYKLKAESSLHMCVELNSSRVCGTHTNFQLLIKLLLKISFCKFFLFSLLRDTRDTFLPCMKWTLNYYQQNFMYAFFKKMTIKYLFE